jgi:hypothetical protein
MRLDGFKDWLVADLDVFGVHGQNWWVLASALIVLAILYLALTQNAARHPGN